MEKFTEEIKSQLNFDRYVKLIQFASKYTFSEDEYGENHHIVPRSMGGSNRKENIIRLTARMHYLAHLFLWRAFRNRSMCFSFHIFQCSMANRHQKRKFNSRLFSVMREEFSRYMSERQLGHKQTQEIINKRVEKNRGKTRPKEAVKITAEKNIGKRRTDTSKENISAALKNSKSKKIECEHCSVLSDAVNYRRWHGDKCKLFTGLSYKQKPSETVTCPHCGKTGSARGIKGSHFDRCKFAPSNILEPILSTSD